MRTGNNEGWSELTNMWHEVTVFEDDGHYTARYHGCAVAQYMANSDDTGVTAVRELLKRADQHIDPILVNAALHRESIYRRRPPRDSERHLLNLGQKWADHIASAAQLTKIEKTQLSCAIHFYKGDRTRNPPLANGDFQKLCGKVTEIRLKGKTLFLAEEIGTPSRLCLIEAERVISISAKP